MISYLKEKLVGVTGSISGVASILGSWQVCHNICLGIIALLSIIGITVVGMPLLFLTKIALPLWTIAVILLLLTIVIYFKKKCISLNLILINSGLIIIGIPFQPLQRFPIVLWVVGGVFVTLGIIRIVDKKMQKRRVKNEKKL